MLELSVLAVPDCPNGPVLLERLGLVLADYPDARVTGRVIRDEAEAVRLGMHGSPTLLVNGIDPFAAPGSPASVSCRVYRAESGRSQGAPSVAALRQVVRQAAAGTGPVSSSPVASACLFMAGFDNRGLSNPDRQFTVVVWLR